MSERGHFRGGGRGGAGGHGGNRGGRGGGGGRGGRDQQSNQPHEKPKKENILDLTKYVDKQINVKFNGGRESGCLLDMLLQKQSHADLSSPHSCRDSEGLRPIDESSIRRC